MNQRTSILTVVWLIVFATASAVADPNTFTEALSTDWHTNGNWSYGTVPQDDEDVLIPDGKTCIISTANAEAYTVEVEDGATLENRGKWLEIDRTLTVDGTVYLTKPVGGSTPIIKFTTAFTGASITGSGTVDAAKPDHGPGHLTWLDIPCESALQIDCGVTLKGSITIDISINNDGTLLVDHARDTMWLKDLACVEGEASSR